jgi:hypothetical protein
MTPEQSSEMFTYVRVVLSIVTGLGLTHLLQGMALFVQHPQRNKIYLPHLLWSFSMTIRILHFWWFEHALDKVPVWTFGIYLLVVGYAVVNYLMCTLLYPKELAEFDSYKDYFLSRKNWFYGLLILAFLFDLADSWMKGHSYFAALGAEYITRTILIIAGALVGIFAKGERYHYVFVSLYLTYQLIWIFRMFDVPR